MAADALTVSSHQSGATVTIELVGELDLHGAPRLTAAIQKAVSQRPDSIDLDTQGLSFIDSSGLRTLLVGWHEAEAVAVKLRIVKTSPAVDQILAMTGADAALRDGTS